MRPSVDDPTLKYNEFFGELCYHPVMYATLGDTPLNTEVKKFILKACRSTPGEIPALTKIPIAIGDVFNAVIRLKDGFYNLSWLQANIVDGKLVIKACSVNPILKF